MFAVASAPTQSQSATKAKTNVPKFGNDTLVVEREYFSGGLPKNLNEVWGEGQMFVPAAGFGRLDGVAIPERIRQVFHETLGRNSEGQKWLMVQ
jgi:hypothetical protein